MTVDPAKAAAHFEHRGETYFFCARGCAQKFSADPQRYLNPSPTAADAIEDEVQEALAICGGDAIAALRITLIANAFLEAEVDRLSAAVSSGFARGKVRKAPTSKKAKENKTHL